MQLPGNRLRKQAGACFYVILLIFFKFPLLQEQYKGQAGGEGKEWSVFLHTLLDKMKAVTQESL